MMWGERKKLILVVSWLLRGLLVGVVVHGLRKLRSHQLSILVAFCDLLGDLLGDLSLLQCLGPCLDEGGFGRRLLGYLGARGLLLGSLLGSLPGLHIFGTDEHVGQVISRLLLRIFVDLVQNVVRIHHVKLLAAGLGSFLVRCASFHGRLVLLGCHEFLLLDELGLFEGFMMNHSCFLGIHGGRGSQPPCVLWLLRSRAHVVGMLLFLRCLEVVEHVLWHGLVEPQEVFGAPFLHLRVLWLGSRGRLGHRRVV